MGGPRARAAAAGYSLAMSRPPAPDLRSSLLRHAWLRTGLWLALAAVANHLAGAAWARVDLTRDQRYTLSDVAVRAVRGLERPLVARVFFTGGLDAPYHEHEGALLDLLDELRAQSGGRLEVQVTDPTGDKAAVEEARQYGIEPVTLTVRQWDRQEARQVFMGVALLYGDRTETVAAFTAVERMEYDITRAIRRVTTPPDDRPQVAYLLGHGEPDLASFPADHPLGRLRAALSAAYDLRPLPLGDEPVPADIDAMLVVAPQQAVPPMAQLHLDQLLMAGKPVAWFLSGVQPDFPRMRTREVRHDLHGLLAAYGLTVGRDLVLDRQSNEPMVVPVGPGSQVAKVSYPLAVATTDIDRSARPVRALRRAVLPFATTLAVSPDLPDDLTAEVWIRSMPTSVASRGGRPLAVDRVGAVASDEVRGPFPMAVALTGTFPSAWADRPLPTPEDPAAAAPDPAELLTTSRPARMVVVSSGDFVANNIGFVVDVVDWLLDDPSLIGIRAIQAGEDPLEAPPAASAWRWKLAIAAGPWTVLALVGAWMWRRSR